MTKVTLYGIPNCGSVKEAKHYLKENQVEYDFHDFKKLGLDMSLLNRWTKSIDWETLLNKRGTTWRKLDEASKTDVDHNKALRLMSENPSLVKRPVLEANGTILVGFSADQYRKLECLA